jgi:hypothetical protein
VHFKGYLSIIKQLIKKRESLVPKESGLLSSYLYGVDDNKILSPETKLVSADVGEVKVPSDKTQ